MKRLFFLLIPLLCLGAANPSSRFTYVDVFIDPKGKPLAAWQFEFAAEVGEISLVGVEGGDSPAFAERPPYYDPAALAGRRIVLANYSVAADLPKGKVRVARLMLEVRGDAKPQYVTKLIAAADADGKTIAVDLSVVEK
jgi:hypothetical protein